MNCCEKEDMQSLPEMFGVNVFNDAAQRARLPKNVYKKLMATIGDGKELDPSIADVVANAMKDWAIEKGATHFCHWFQPMTGITAEKHDSFISPTSDGRIMMEFSGKELTQGEPMPPRFRPAVCVPPLKPAATRCGTAPRLCSSKRMGRIPPCSFRRPSRPIRERRWIRRRRCCGRCRR